VRLEQRFWRGSEDFFLRAVRAVFTKRSTTLPSWLRPSYGLATSHPYHDGNKRIAFLTMAVFLGLNDRDLQASEAEVVSTMLAS
jgi:hypothetical protein